MTASRTPTAVPLASRVALVLALALLGLAAVSVHDLATVRGWAAGSSWTAAAVDAVDGVSASTGVALAGAVLAVLGVLLVLVACWPARRTHVALGDSPDGWITPGAVAALAREVADRSAGVLEARTAKVSRREVRITVASVEDATGTAKKAQHDVDHALGGLVRPTVSVRGSVGARS